MAKNPWHKIFGKDPAPDVRMFVNFKKVWPRVDTSAAIKKVNIPELERVELVELFSTLLLRENNKKELFIRGDYRELCEIAVVLLGGELPGGKEMFWKKPGATHKARFLAFGLCALKIWAFSEQQVIKDGCLTRIKKKKKPAAKKRGRPAKKVVLVPAQKRPVRKKAAPPQRKDTESEEETDEETETESIYEKEKLELLERFCVYAVKFYIPFFLTANIGVNAAVTDLSLYKKLKKFSQVDKELADEALATLSRHLWFLAPTTVLFSLASEKLEDDDKSRIAAKLVSLPKPKEMHKGLPTFPKLTDKTELWDLVTSDSWELFDILKLSPDWLALPPTEWDTSPDYIEFRNFVRTVKVTNDCAERAVKLATDYSKSLTKDSQERSKIYQVVEAERRAKPDANKNTLNK